MKRIFCVFVAGVLFPFTVPAETTSSAPPLHSLTIEQDSIVFEVTSHGCSKDADFKLHVNGGTNITLLRTRPDFCKRTPMIFRIRRSLSDAGLSRQTPFSVSNPFTPPPSKGKARIGKPAGKQKK